MSIPYNPYTSNPYMASQPYQSNPYANYGFQPQQPQAQPQAPSGSGILWVQGEAGAKSYLVGAGQSVMLMDSESSTFYIKSVDASGMPHPIRVFDYTERTTNQQGAPAAGQANPQDVPYATKEQVQVLYRRIEELENLLFTPQQPQPQAQSQGELNNGKSTV